MFAPPLAAKSVNTGATEVMSYRKFLQPTVIYIFAPTCSWCARNRANIASLAQQCKGRFHFVALSLSERGVTSSLSKLGVGMPAYVDASAEFVQSLNLRATPQLLVISREGKVIENWIGTGHEKEIEAYFHVRLPGLLSPLRTN
jgi:thioredoxin-related protein